MTREVFPRDAQAPRDRDHRCRRCGWPGLDGGQGGYTFTELLVVLVIVGTLLFFTVPKFSGLMERRQIDAARSDVAAAIVAARSAAIQKGRAATVWLSGNSIRVTVRAASGAQATVVPLTPLGSRYRVVVASTDTAITFDARGFLSPRLASIGVYRILGLSRRDSVCVTPTGQIMPRSCTL